MTTNICATGHAIEQALGRGHVWALMRNGRYWVLRRNGKTKLWKTRPEHFRIPVKAGLKACDYLTHDSSISIDSYSRPDFLISGIDPNPPKR